VVECQIVDSIQHTFQRCSQKGWSWFSGWNSQFNFKAIASYTISLHPVYKTENKNGVYIKLHSGPCFPEHNNLFWINFSGMYYFQFRIFLSRMRFWFFFSRFLYPKHKSLFWIYFSGMHYFQFWIFISGIKGIFRIFEIMLDVGSKVLGAGSICLNLICSG